MRSMTKSTPTRATLFAEDNAVIATKTPPPGSSTRTLLTALKQQNAVLPASLIETRVLCTKAGAPSTKSRRATAYKIEGATLSNLETLTDRSSDAALELAAAEFWAATSVEGSPWEDNKPVIGAVDLAINKVSRQHSVEIADWQQYKKDERDKKGVAYVKQRQAELIHHEQEISPEAVYPELFFAFALGLDKEPERYRWTCLVIDVTVSVTAVAVQRLKHRLLVPRPYEIDEQIKPSQRIDRPMYSAFPSGHATICYALVTVLSNLTSDDGQTDTALSGLAERISVNRERAGLHTGIDTEQGNKLGTELARSMLAAANAPEFSVWGAVLAAARKEWNPQ